MCGFIYTTLLYQAAFLLPYTMSGTHTHLNSYTTFACFTTSLAVPRPDPNTPRPEGRQIIPVKGEPLGVVSNWPPALQAALARWGATQGKSPALTTLDITGKPLYTLTYGKRKSFNYE